MIKQKQSHSVPTTVGKQFQNQFLATSSRSRTIEVHQPDPADNVSVGSFGIKENAQVERGINNFGLKHLKASEVRQKFKNRNRLSSNLMNSVSEHRSESIDSCLPKALKQCSTSRQVLEREHSSPSIHILQKENMRLKSNLASVMSQFEEMERRLNAELNKRKPLLRAKSERHSDSKIIGASPEQLVSQQIINAQKRCKIYKKQIETLRHRCSLYNEQKVNQLNHELESLKKLCKIYENENKEIKRALKEYESKYFSIDDDKSAEQVRKELQSLRAQNKRIKTRIKKQEQDERLEILTLKNELSKAKKQRDVCQYQKVIQINSIKSQAKKQLSMQIQKMKSQFQNKIENFLVQKEQSLKKIEQMNKTNEQLNIKLCELSQQNSKLEKRINILQETNNQVQIKCEHLTLELLQQSQNKVINVQKSQKETQTEMNFFDQDYVEGSNSALRRSKQKKQKFKELIHEQKQKSEIFCSKHELQKKQNEQNENNCLFVTANPSCKETIENILPKGESKMSNNEFMQQFIINEKLSPQDKEENLNQLQNKNFQLNDKQSQMKEKVSQNGEQQQKYRQFLEKNIMEQEHIEQTSSNIPGKSIIEQQPMSEQNQMQGESVPNVSIDNCLEQKEQYFVSNNGKYPYKVSMGESHPESLKHAQFAVQTKIKEVGVSLHTNGHIQKIYFEYDQLPPTIEKQESLHWNAFRCEQNEEFIKDISFCFQMGHLTGVSVASNWGRKWSCGQNDQTAKNQTLSIVTAHNQYPTAVFWESLNQSIIRVGCLVHLQKSNFNNEIQG